MPGHNAVRSRPRRLLGAAILVLSLTLLAANVVSGWWQRHPEEPAAQPQIADLPPVPEPEAAPEPEPTDVWTVPERYRGRVISSRVRQFPEKLLALTFDDGPDPTVTPRVLEALAEHDARATFFVLGKQAQANPELLQAIVEAGHAVGNHSYSHAERYSAAEAADEFERTCALVEQAAGRPPTLFRPPYGITDTALCDLALERGNAAIMWTISSADSRPIGPDVIARNIIHTPNPGDIVLMHDGPGHSATAQALPQILAELSAAGFRFVTLPELMQAWDRWLSDQPADPIRTPN